MEKIVEICCGSYYDAKQATLGGAKRIELNSALYLGGLTPGLATLDLVKEKLDVQVIAMVRPRGAGFCYIEEDFEVMQKECELLLQHGADGIAFGCLNEDWSLDVEKNKILMEIIKKYQGEAVFHRAFDCTKNPMDAMEDLVKMGVDRLLTSGQQPKAWDGAPLIKVLQKEFGHKIEILAGSGVNAGNAVSLMEMTGIHQVHSSGKDWLEDATTSLANISYSYAAKPFENYYEVVSRSLVEKLIKSVKKSGEV